MRPEHCFGSAKKPNSWCVMYFAEGSVGLFLPPGLTRRGCFLQEQYWTIIVHAFHSYQRFHEGMTPSCPTFTLWLKTKSNDIN